MRDAEIKPFTPVPTPEIDARLFAGEADTYRRMADDFRARAAMCDATADEFEAKAAELRSQLQSEVAVHSIE